MAAKYVWLCAALSLMMSFCCVFSAIGLTIVPSDELVRQLPKDMPNRDQIIQVLPAMAMLMGVVGVLLMLLPAVALGILGFPVRSGNRGATFASMVILGVQGLLLALLSLKILLDVLLGGSIGDLIVFIVLACVIAAIVKAIAALRSALRSTRNDPQDPPSIEPWGY
jgi:hypothetical protein